MSVDYEQVIHHFLESEYDVQTVTFGGRTVLQVTADIAGKQVHILHKLQEDIVCLPRFFLKNVSQYPQLAHIGPVDSIDCASICVNELDSVSVNFDRPDLAFEESIKRHFRLLENAIVDQEWNRQELLREFSPNWITLAAFPFDRIYCAVKSGQLGKIDVYNPINKKGIESLASSYIGISEDNSELNVLSYLDNKNRSKADGVGYIIPLIKLEPAPKSVDDLKGWFITALSHISQENKLDFQRNYAQFKANTFRLIFNAPTPSGIVWFGLKLTSDKKKSMPIKEVDLNLWDISFIDVKIFNKELLMPRSGANPSLDNKRVLLIGCGSVGSEVALKLGAAGIGKFYISDPDELSISNLYRHALDKKWIGFNKAKAMTYDLSSRFPWIHCKTIGDIDGYIYEYCNDDAIGYLNSFDLIVIAIGSPTQERFFHKFLTRKKVKTPVINTWLEGYGIGGHATLDIPKSKGCLLCAYVEVDTGVQGLASNLNFIEPNQNIVKNYAGCGEMFIPYGAISSSQTALVAANLAISYLEGKVVSSKKVSWKGAPEDALTESIKLSDRYQNFNDSLFQTSLYSPMCDVCQSGVALTFSNDSVSVSITEDVFDLWMGFRQIKKEADESAGLLIGRLISDNNYLIDGITTPKDTDVNERCYFKLDDKVHETDIKEAFNESNGARSYLGTWHTHPQEDPIPSSIDITDWKGHEKENRDRTLFFPVIGTDIIRMFVIKDNEKIELRSKSEIE